MTKLKAILGSAMLAFGVSGCNSLPAAPGSYSAEVTNLNYVEWDTKQTAHEIGKMSIRVEPVVLKATESEDVRYRIVNLDVAPEKFMGLYVAMVDIQPVLPEAQDALFKITLTNKNSRVVRLTETIVAAAVNSQTANVRISEAGGRSTNEYFNTKIILPNQTEVFTLALSNIKKYGDQGHIQINFFDLPVTVNADTGDIEKKANLDTLFEYSLSKQQFDTVAVNKELLMSASKLQRLQGDYRDQTLLTEDQVWSIVTDMTKGEYQSKASAAN